MAIPVVAIVGRPNVGKSSLFNWLAGRRIAIVEPTAGVTRDRMSSLVKAGDRFFELVDTGGIGVEDVDNLTPLIEQQIQTALEEASVVLFVVDVRTGMMGLDEEVAQRLRSFSKPILLLANKADTEPLEANAAEFYKLGGGNLLCVSAQQNRHKQELLDLIRERLPSPEAPEPEQEAALKLAIVGRRNTGKSTFINSLAKGERVIVSEVPGTTRDSIDVRFERDGKVFIAIDTAGARRKKSIANSIEFYSLARAERSIRRADVVLLFHDPRMTISKVDKQLAHYVLENHKPAIFVVNKWDLAAGLPTGTFAKYIHATFPSLDFLPIAFITAKNGRNVYPVLNLAQNLHKQASVRVGTGALNQVLKQALAEQAPPLRQNRRPKIYYATQVATNPPTIVLFTNGPHLIDPTYERYLLKTFRDRLPFHEIPIKLYLRQRGRQELVPEDAAPRETHVAARKSARNVARVAAGRKAPKKHPIKGKKTSQPELWKDL